MWQVSDSLNCSFYEESLKPFVCGMMLLNFYSLVHDLEAV